jgi:transcriptional antiterminator RfaH
MDLTAHPRLKNGPAPIEPIGTKWFVARTNSGKERVAMSQLNLIVTEVLLPLVRTRIRRWGKLVDSVGPLFPGYLFAKFNFERDYGRVRYARGLRGFVCFGKEPAVVFEWMIEQLKERCAAGPVELPERSLVPTESVVVIDGPFKEFEGIFERYMSGHERVSVLLAMLKAGPRIILPARHVIPAQPGSSGRA